jgi:hypothetical protein
MSQIHSGALAGAHGAGDGLFGKRSPHTNIPLTAAPAPPRRIIIIAACPADDRHRDRHCPARRAAKYATSWRDGDLSARWSRAVVELVRAAHPGDLDPEVAL